MSLKDYKGLLNADTRPMDQDVCKVMFSILSVPDDKFHLIEEDLQDEMLYQVACKRVVLMHDLFNEEVDRKLLVFVTRLCDNPAKVVMWLFTLHLMFLLLKRPATLDDFCRNYFPNGIPTDKACKKAWDRQKRETPKHSLESDNSLDYFELWPKEIKHDD